MNGELHNCIVQMKKRDFHLFVKKSIDLFEEEYARTFIIEIKLVSFLANDNFS